MSEWVCRCVWCMCSVCDVDMFLYGCHFISSVIHHRRKEARVYSFLLCWDCSTACTVLCAPNVLTYVLAHSPFDSIFHSTASHTPHTHKQINKHKASAAHTLYTLERFSHLFVHSHFVFCEMYKWHGTNNVSLVTSF